MVEPHSPLTTRIERGGRDGADGRRQLRIVEVRPVHLLQLGVFPGGMTRIDPMVHELTGARLPESPNEVTHAGSHRLYRIAPDQYWLRYADAHAALALEDRVPAEYGSVTRLDAARVCVRLEGSAAVALLTHLVPLDLHLSAFSPGQFAQTGMAHTGVLIERLTADRFEILLLATYAASTFDLLIDAAWPYGYDLATDSPASGTGGPKNLSSGGSR